jgi:hypothetical protein
VQSCVQAPPVQYVGPEVPSSGVHRPETHSTFQAQGAPMGPGVTGGGSQVPVLALQLSVLPQDQPSRQSGRHAFTDVAHTYPLRHSSLPWQEDTQ